MWIFLRRWEDWQLVFLERLFNLPFFDFLMLFLFPFFFVETGGIAYTIFFCERTTVVDKFKIKKNVGFFLWLRVMVTLLYFCRDSVLHTSLLNTTFAIIFFTLDKSRCVSLINTRICLTIFCVMWQKNVFSVMEALDFQKKLVILQIFCTTSKSQIQRCPGNKSHSGILAAYLGKNILLHLCIWMSTNFYIYLVEHSDETSKEAR